MAAERMRRVDEAIRQVLADVLAGELADPRVGFVTVTDVKTSPDLRTARVFVSVLGDDAARDGLARRAAQRPRPAAAPGRQRAAPAPHADAGVRLRPDHRSRAARRRAAAGAAVSDGRPRSPLDTREQVLREIRAGERFVVVSHEHPDGDALGSLVAMQGVLRALGKDSVVVIAPEEFPLPREYRFFALDGLATQAPDDLDARDRDLPGLRQHRPHPDRGAARRRDDHQHRPPPRQHALRHGQPRRRGGLVHRRARLGADARAGGRAHGADRGGALRRSRDRHRPLLLREHHAARPPDGRRADRGRRRRRPRSTARSTRGSRRRSSTCSRARWAWSSATTAAA